MITKEDLEAVLRKVLTETYGDFDDRLSTIEQKIAPMEPMLAEYQERKAAIQFGEKIGKRIGTIGKVMAWIFGGMITMWAAIKTGWAAIISEFLNELAKHGDKIPPNIPPGGQ